MKPLHLAAVREQPRADESPRTEGSDLVLVSALFALSLVPVIGELAHLGRWSPGIVGFAAAASLLTGRELWSQVRARWKRRM